MTSTIITKNSSTASSVPTAGQIEQGELAVNVTDKKLYTKDSSGTIVKLVGSLGNQEASAVAITGGTITGLGTPSSSSDAATKSYVDTILGDTVTAAASAAAAATSEANAATSETNAAASASAAATSAAEAAASAASIADGPVVSVNGMTGIVTGLREDTETISVIGTNTNAVKATVYILTASLTLTLPSSPTVGDWVTVQNSSGTTTAVVGRNGSNIMSTAEDMTIDSANAFFTLVYSDATRGWVIV